MSVVVPRKPELHRILGRFNARIRHLEINRDNGYTHGGLAIYTASYSDMTPGDTWTPDFSSASKVMDTIGCQAGTDGVQIPPYWMWWAMVDFSIKTGGAPTAGDFAQWEASVASALVGTHGYDPMLNSSSTAQVFGGAVAGVASTDGSLIGLNEVTAVLGTTFVPVAYTIAVTAIQLFTPPLDEDED